MGETLSNEAYFYFLLQEGASHPLFPHFRYLCYYFMSRACPRNKARLLGWSFITKKWGFQGQNTISVKKILKNVNTRAGSSDYLRSIIFPWDAFGSIHLLPVALSQFLPFSLMYKESTLRRYNLSTKSRESPKMEKPYRSLITHSLFGLSCANSYKANKPLFPRRLLELLLSIKDFSILCASTFVILFSYFNIFGGF